MLGPAEVAAWGILGTLWDALELVTEAVADAGEVRTGFLLGAGRPAQAKLSSMKTLYLGIFVSILITSCMFIAGESIPTWMTNDPTLQRMIAELIPLFGIGNIALSLGTLSWTLVGSQSRYRLSTTVGLSGAWFVAIPLATILTIVYNVDLQGQTAAIVIGYMVSGTANSYILLQTDWPKQSRRVIAQAGGIIVDDGDDNDSSSSSSSSSNDASSDGTDAEQIEAIVNNSATTAMSVPKANTTNISSATNKASKNVTPISDVNDNPAPSNEMNASSHASKKSTNTTDKLTPPTVKTRIVSISKSEDSGALASNRKEKLNDESRVSSTSSGSKTVPRRNRAKDRGSMKTEERNIGSVSDVAPVGDSIQRIRPVVVSKRRKNLDPNTVKSAK